MHNRKEKRILFFKHGARARGCVVIQHQKEETMAKILLARAGKQMTNEVFHI